MMKKLLALCLAVFTLSMGSINAFAADSKVAYWHETTRAQTRSGWMDWIPDDRRLSELSLPGTHDTMSYISSTTDIVQNQTMGLYEQLMSGIRYIDIRVHYESPTYLTSYHGPIYLSSDFDHVLAVIEKFLKENPRESVYMRLKQENSNASDAQMEQVFYYYHQKHKDLFYNGTDKNPKLGETRGKLVLISDVLSLNKYGIDYRDLDKQDRHHLNTNWDLYSKWENVKAQLHKADNKKDNTIYLNYLSASGGVMPYFVASGNISPGTYDPNLSTALTEPAFRGRYPDFPRGARLGALATIFFEGTNVLTANWIAKNKPDYVGIVAADFPGAKLINEIIECNARYK